MWENAYLSIKNLKASRALKRALDPGRKLLAFAHATPLRYVGNFRPQHLGPPLDQILDPHLTFLFHILWHSIWRSVYLLIFSVVFFWM